MNYKKKILLIILIFLFLSSLFYNVGITVLTFNFNSLANTNYFTYIIPMDSIYKNEGFYEDLWF